MLIVLVPGFAPGIFSSGIRIFFTTYSHPLCKIVANELQVIFKLYSCRIKV